MAHHAYFLAGEAEEGIARTLAFVEKELGLTAVGNPDVLVLRYDLFSVDDARTVADMAVRTSAKGDGRAIIVSAQRFFHEAQNALLKTFEEPSEGTSLFLIVPSVGTLSATLRSRLLPLPGSDTGNAYALAEAFAHANKEGREKLVEKLLARAKSDKAEEKQAVRIDTLSLAQGLATLGYALRKGSDDVELLNFLDDLDRFIPILHERAAPLKLILEHILIVAPKKLTR